MKTFLVIFLLCFGIALTMLLFNPAIPSSQREVIGFPPIVTIVSTTGYFHSNISGRNFIIVISPSIFFAFLAGFTAGKSKYRK